MEAVGGLILACVEEARRQRAIGVAAMVREAAPSYYGVFSLLWNGRLLSDHYVSKGRFRYILRDEIQQESR